MNEKKQPFLPTLNLPQFPVDFKVENGKYRFFDSFRHLWIVFTPEEYVRYQSLLFLVHVKGYPFELIGVEKSLKYNNLRKRLDAVVFSKKGEPLVLVEFKKQEVFIDEKVFLQAATYNTIFRAPYLFLSNGMNHYFLKINIDNKSIDLLPEIPNWNDLTI